MDAAALLEGGWTALADARWEEAHDLFSRAVAEEESAEALEGLSWAAWWLDDADAVFESREHAFRLYRRRGDARSAARMATWLAIDELDFNGALAVAGGWVARAERLLEGEPDGPEHGWLAFQRGYLARLAGDTAEAVRLGIQVAETGRRFGVSDLEMLGLALEGSALVGASEVSEGMARLDEATACALARDAAIPIAGAWTCCFLVTACTTVFDYDRAAEWCDRIAEFSERYGSRYMLAFCRAEYGAIHLWRGRFAEAGALLEAAVEDAVGSRPAFAAAPLAALAELRRRQGLPAEAEALLDRAGAWPAAELCRARIALDAGDLTRASEILERLRAIRPAGPRPDALPGLELLVRCRAAAGDAVGADEALEELRAVGGLASSEAVDAIVTRAAGLVASAAGDAAGAVALLQEATGAFERADAPYEAACTRLLAAEALEEAGREAEARRERRAASGALDAVGAGPPGKGAEPLAMLTPREREVLALIAEGLTNRAIADALVLSEHTVHRHVANILRKLDAPSRAVAAARAAEAGLAV